MATRLPAATRRRQLLEVALEEFSARGFHQTSMEEIADAARVTKPVLYQHYRSKRELYLQLLDDVCAQFWETICLATAAAEGPHGQVAFRFEAYFCFVAEHGNAFRLSFGSGARRDAEFDDAVRRVDAAI